MVEPVLVDTSAAVAMVIAFHRDHESAFAALDGRRPSAVGRRPGRCGHDAFESFSVLTHVPGAQRLSPPVARRLLDTNFPETRQLSGTAATQLLASLAQQDIAGPAMHIAPVATTAVEQGLSLSRRARRATENYRWLGLQLELLPPT